MKPGPKRKYNDEERRLRANASSRRSRAKRAAEDPVGYKARIREQSQRLYARHGDDIKFRVQLRKHGLTEAQFNSMLEAQGHKCVICSAKLDPPCVDHDHNCCPGEGSCGKCVRALLCGLCNKALGFAKDDPFILERAAAYLRSHA